MAQTEKEHCLVNESEIDATGIKGEETRWEKDDDKERAELEEVKHVGRQSFKEEFDTLQMKRVDAAPKQQQVNRTSATHRLDSVMSEDGVLRVGGRLRNAKHPIIKPKKHPAVEAIIRDCHEACGHSGREHVMSLVRESFWILGGRSTI